MNLATIRYRVIPQLRALSRLGIGAQFPVIEAEDAALLFGQLVALRVSVDPINWLLTNHRKLTARIAFDNLMGNAWDRVTPWQESVQWFQHRQLSIEVPRGWITPDDHWDEISLLGRIWELPATTDPLAWLLAVEPELTAALALDRLMAAGRPLSPAFSHPHDEPVGEVISEEDVDACLAAGTLEVVIERFTRTTLGFGLTGRWRLTAVDGLAHQSAYGWTGWITAEDNQGFAHPEPFGQPADRRTTKDVWREWRQSFFPALAPDANRLHLSARPVLLFDNYPADDRQPSSIPVYVEVAQALDLDLPIPRV